MRLLVFDDPELQGRVEWLVDDADVHEAMPALARQAYRRNRRDVPEAAGPARAAQGARHGRRRALRAAARGLTQLRDLPLERLDAAFERAHAIARGR